MKLTWWQSKLFTRQQFVPNFHNSHDKLLWLVMSFNIILFCAVWSWKIQQNLPNFVIVLVTFFHFPYKLSSESWKNCYNCNTLLQFYNFQKCSQHFKKICDKLLSKRIKSCLNCFYYCFMQDWYWIRDTFQISEWSVNLCKTTICRSIASPANLTFQLFNPGSALSWAGPDWDSLRTK